MGKPNITLLFIDGLGIGDNDPKINPLVVAKLPAFQSILGTLNPDDWRDGISHENVSLVPLDATLGIPGRPQSATGHTTIYTGVNAPKLLGKHKQGFPNRKLRNLLRRRGVLPVLHRAGIRVQFVNAYHKPTLSEYKKRRRPFSATSVMAMSAFGDFPGTELIAKRQAVYHDITNRTLRCRGETAPIIHPTEAGSIVAEIAERNNFTLYEYFLSDIAGHRQRMRRNVLYLEMYDSFLSGVIAGSDLDKQTILIISDHGNLEDLSIRTHTKNPVPFIAIGKDHNFFVSDVKTIADPYHKILDVFDVSPPRFSIF